MLRLLLLFIILLPGIATAIPTTPSASYFAARQQSLSLFQDDLARQRQELKALAQRQEMQLKRLDQLGAEPLAPLTEDAQAEIFPADAEGGDPTVRTDNNEQAREAYLKELVQQTAQDLKESRIAHERLLLDRAATQTTIQRLKREIAHGEEVLRQHRRSATSADAARAAAQRHALTSLNATLQANRAHLVVERRFLALIKQAEALVKERQEQAEAWRERIGGYHQQNRREERKEALEELKGRWRQEIAQLRQRTENWNRRLKSDEERPENSQNRNAEEQHLRLLVAETEERIKLRQFRIRTTELESQARDLTARLKTIEQGAMVSELAPGREATSPIKTSSPDTIGRADPGDTTSPPQKDQSGGGSDSPGAAVQSAEPHERDAVLPKSTTPLSQVLQTITGLKPQVEESEAVQTEATPQHLHRKTLQNRLLEEKKRWQSLLRECVANRSLFTGKIALLARQKESITALDNLKPNLREARIRGLDALIRVYRELYERTRKLTDAGTAQRQRILTALASSTREDLLNRRSLREDPIIRDRLINALLELPGVLAIKSRDALFETLHAFSHRPRQDHLLLGALMLALLLLMWRIQSSPARAALMARIDHIEGIPFSQGHILKATMELVTLVILRNRALLFFTLPALALVALAEVTAPTNQLLYVLLLTPLTLHMIPHALDMTTLGVPKAERSFGEKLLRFETIVLLGGATIATLLGRILIFAPELQDLIDRSAMLAVLLVTIPLLMRRKKIKKRIQKRLGKHHWKWSAHLIARIPPFAMLATALPGVFGYLNLAWELGWHLLWFFLVLSGWALIHGILGDLSAWLKNYANIHSKNGLLWTQGVIAPLTHLLSGALLLIALSRLIDLFGWGVGSPPGEAALSVWHHVLFGWGSLQLEIADLVITVASLALLFWAGRWVRQVTFRWVYSRIRDQGVRHSLSVFTQYCVVLFGFLLTLRAVGFDLTSITVLAGGLGIGIGFGMQNIANNFISGLLLLAERPLQQGDFIQLENSEGMVTRIGMRSLTVQTLDNRELIVPNSQVITRTVTNCSHSDTHVRTSTVVGVHYNSDPHHAAEVMEKALASCRHVLTDPEPEILLTGFGDSSLDFTVQYYFDITRHGRLSVRSQVMFAIWDHLKAAGITIPYPQRDLHHYRTTPHRT